MDPFLWEDIEARREIPGFIWYPQEWRPQAVPVERRPGSHWLQPNLQQLKLPIEVLGASNKESCLARDAKWGVRQRSGKEKEGGKGE